MESGVAQWWWWWCCYLCHCDWNKEATQYKVVNERGNHHLHHPCLLPCQLQEHLYKYPFLALSILSYTIYKLC